MLLEVTIKTIGALQSGEKKDGTGQWFAKDLVLEVNDGTRYPDEFAVRLTGENAQSDELKEGQTCMADISFSAREYKGRMYQDSWVRSLSPTAPPSLSDTSPLGEGEEKPQVSESEDDMPF